MVAVMVLVPALIALATPCGSMVATPVLEDVQADVFVMPAVDPSLNVPVATNCCVVPTLIDVLAGVMAIDTRVALVTFSVALPICPAKRADMVTVPA